VTPFLKKLGNETGIAHTKIVTKKKKGSNVKSPHLEAFKRSKRSANAPQFRTAHKDCREPQGLKNVALQRALGSGRRDATRAFEKEHILRTLLT
jgi:hypothetical protein